MKITTVFTLSALSFALIGCEPTPEERPGASPTTPTGTTTPTDPETTRSTTAPAGGDPLNSPTVTPNGGTPIPEPTDLQTTTPPESNEKQVTPDVQEKPASGLPTGETGEGAS